MKNKIVLSLALYSFLPFSVHAMESQSHAIEPMENINCEAEISRHYAERTEGLLAFFWVNNLTRLTINNDPTNRAEIAKQLFIIVKQIKKIKASPSNTFDVLQNFNNAIQQTGILDIPHEESFGCKNRYLINKLCEMHDEIVIQSQYRSTETL